MILTKVYIQPYSNTSPKKAKTPLVKSCDQKVRLTVERILTTLLWMFSGFTLVAIHACSGPNLKLPSRMVRRVPGLFNPEINHQAGSNNPSQSRKRSRLDGSSCSSQEEEYPQHKRRKLKISSSGHPPVSILNNEANPIKKSLDIINEPKRPTKRRLEPTSYL
ncbi:MULTISPECIES: hypothetical protein [unclassified Candidatus Cardinium]|uniref:hypothetical protein n=1 Tax=unclassified Candidatus Cardinium TaxID=2641185 RepID=UPI001FB39A6B|nr:MULTISPECIES: hypothetical protein [unclassified Candidatus Cardinium]